MRNPPLSRGWHRFRWLSCLINRLCLLFTTVATARNQEVHLSLTHAQSCRLGEPPLFCGRRHTHRRRAQKQFGLRQICIYEGLRQRRKHHASTAPEIPISPLQDTSPSASAAGQEDPPLAFLFDGDVSVEADLRCGIF